MKLILTRALTILSLLALLSACSSTPEEKYIDYFYGYQNEKQQDSFTYILYLGEKGSGGLPQNENYSNGQPQRQKQTSRKNQSSSRKSKADEGDNFMSLAFRMEEEAFDRLEVMLATKNYCKGEVEYLENEYTWLRYTIKGFCKS